MNSLFAVAPHIVYWAEDPSRSRVVKARCKRCIAIIGEGYAASGWRQGIVSPSGIEHLTHSEMTLCGIDGTGPDWWWPV